ncbi:MAG: prepilin peptidase [Lachnospiraceae bacterium]|nr:prepilin peptidase [Lachnospiraceae bacterium]
MSKYIGIVIIAVLLIYETVLDVKEKKVDVILPIIFGSVYFSFSVLLNGPKTVLSSLLGAGIGMVILIAALISKERIGIGDAVILVSTGIILGGENNLILFVRALILAGVYCVVLIVVRKIGGKAIAKREKIQFCPFLLLSFGLLCIG